MIQGKVWQEEDGFVATIFDGWYVGRGRTAKEAQTNVTRAFENEQALLGGFDDERPLEPRQLTLWSMDDGK